jgi:RimJ/RimL family protein N-acetyltransferase
MKLLPEIRLRACERTDADRAYEFFGDMEFRALVLPGTIMPISREQEVAFIERLVNPKDKEKAFEFAVENERGEYIGNCGYFDASHKNRTCYIGVGIGDKSCWGKGYGTAALRKLLEFLFREKNMRKVLLNVFAFNKRAIASYKKLGFKEEACLREQIYRDGKYHDEYTMAMFAKDFKGG